MVKERLRLLKVGPVARYVSVSRWVQRHRLAMQIKWEVRFLGVPGDRYDTWSLWGLHKMHETVWFCLVSGLSL